MNEIAQACGLTVERRSLIHTPKGLCTPTSLQRPACGAGVSSLVFINLEAVPHRLGSHCAFEDITTFTLHKMLAYRNGKAAGRTSLARWQGPHRFSGESHIVSVEARHPPIPLSPASSPLLVASPAMRQGAHPSALALLWAAGRVCPPLRVMHLRGLAQQVPQAPPHRRARDEGHPIRVLPRLHLPLPVRPDRRAERGALGSSSLASWMLLLSIFKACVH